ncbi:hypothetical protein ACMATS_35920 [Streptoverticillium reticulum]|uniref:hypothetical protein n=1 Tax=Streptoverticillium reticulum TaxID=1433415 RepID=UPI0039BF0D88
MRVATEWPHHRRRRTVVRLWTALLCTLFTVLAAHPAVAADGAAAPAPASQAALLADRLRADPVYVTDQMPRTVPRSTAPDFAALAARTGVPTYVLVLPGNGARTLLGAVHDRLGRDGLYVLVDAMGVADARAFGVRAPAADAQTVALYSLPYDAGPLRSFRTFVDVVGQGSDRAARLADDMRRRHGGGGKDVKALYLSKEDRAGQSFLTGVVLLGAPLSVLLTGAYVRRRRRGQRSDGRRVRLVEPAVAAALAAVVAVGAPQLFHQTTDSAALAPTHADLTARLDRVVTGLQHDPLYTDPESPQLLDGPRRQELHRRIGDFTPGPVYMAVVPLRSEDESAGDVTAFTTALHQRLRKDGVYVVADPLSGRIDLVNYGLPLDDRRLAFELPGTLSHEDYDHASEDHGLGQRLDGLMTFLDGTPRAAAQHSSRPDAAPAPLEDHALPPLYSGDFWPGLLVGALTAGLLLGLTAGGLRVARFVLRIRRTAAAQSPAAPSATWLRRTAAAELKALATEFGAGEPDDGVRKQVWDCLDAAMLLTDRAPDGRIGAAVTPADLAAAVVLARAGRAALRGERIGHCCTVNPLHGPGVTEEKDGTRRAWVCGSCRTLLRSAPHRIGPLRLRLPGKGGGVPYEKAPGPLPAVRRGLPQLIGKTREYVSVQSS